MKTEITELDPWLNAHTNHIEYNIPKYSKTQRSITSIHNFTDLPLSTEPSFRNKMHLYMNTSLLDSLTFWVLAWSCPFEAKCLSSTATITKTQTLGHLRRTVFNVICTGRASQRLLALRWTFSLCSRASRAGEHSFFQTDLLTANDKGVMINLSYQVNHLFYQIALHYLIKAK